MLEHVWSFYLFIDNRSPSWMMPATLSATIIWMLHFEGRVFNSWLHLVPFFTFPSFIHSTSEMYFGRRFLLFFWYFLISKRFYLHWGGVFNAPILIPRVKFFLLGLFGSPATGQKTATSFNHLSCFYRHFKQSHGVPTAEVELDLAWLTYMCDSSLGSLWLLFTYVNIFSIFYYTRNS